MYHKGGYEGTIFNQEFHLKYNGAFIHTISPSSRLRKYGLEHCSNGYVHLVHYIDYTGRQFHLLPVRTEAAHKIIRHLPTSNMSDINAESVRLPLSVFKEEEKHVDIYGYIKNYKDWPSSVLLMMLVDKTTTENIPGFSVRYSKLYKETKGMSEEEKRKFLVSELENLKFYKAL